MRCAPSPLRPESQVIVVTATTGRDPELVEFLTGCGVKVVDGVDLHCETGSGPRTVWVRAGSMRLDASAPIDAIPRDDRPWLDGIERLDDPLESRRFVTSRLLYRRLRRFLWAPPLALAAIALLLRIEWVVNGLGHLFRSPRQQTALQRAYDASWFSRFVDTAVIAVALLVVLAVVVAVTSRGIWRALGGGTLPAPWARGDSGTTGPIAHAQLEIDGEDALDLTRAAVQDGVAGVIAGGSLVPELTHLDAGFFACPGATSEVVHEHRGRLGLPPTFLNHRQESTIEIETGAELHVRLILADAALPTATMGERLVTADSVVKGRTKAAEVHAELKAGWPTGSSWPPAPDVAADHIRVRRIRRIAAVALFAAGAIDLLSAVTAPLRTHLNLIAQYLPVAVVQAAGALVAIAGIGMIMLSRGILKGQRRSWLVAVALLTAALALHLVHAADVVTLLVCAAVLVLLIVQRNLFRAQTERATLIGAFAILAVGGVFATLGGFIGVELAGHVHHHPLPGWPHVLLGSAERLVGVQWVRFPPTINHFASVTLLAVGISLIVLALYLLTRPVVDRSLSSGSAVGRRAAELRARDIVRRHGTGTLDYFALRDDKQWFFHRDSLVAYAVFGGVCLVSPDPIGPFSERAHVWDAFRRYVDRHGWGLGVMGAGEEWLPTYQASGMRFVYIGDEAVVDPRVFSLEGGKMKGLRQAVNRVARYGYTVRFLDPSRLEPRDAARMAELMAKSRRGEQERGFSMMLGRLFDPRDSDLLLTVVEGPDGTPVAMCQFVPSPAIGGYSLDLMRRDPADHPNGLLDFALCSTISHLKERGMTGLSLNFAAMRSILEGESGDGVTQRVERWAIRRLSGVLQIETLWRFNAKYEPRWLPRYVAFDSAEQFVPVAVQIMRAESLTEVPVIGRLLTTGTAKRTAPAVPEEVAAAMDHGDSSSGPNGLEPEHDSEPEPEPTAPRAVGH